MSGAKSRAARLFAKLLRSVLRVDFGYISGEFSSLFKFEPLKIRRIHFLLLLIAFALSPTSRAIAGMVAVTEADNGRELTLSRGDMLEVSLPATSGTGYTWQPAPIADPLAKPVGDMKFKTDHEMPGATGHQIFRYSVDESGNGSIELRYIRPWEKDTPPAKVFKLLLIVR